MSKKLTDYIAIEFYLLRNAIVFKKYIFQYSTRKHEFKFLKYIQNLTALNDCNTTPSK